jgi:tetratricopeptide (TPR) repeat protein
MVAIHESRPDPDPVALADALNSLGNLRWRQDRHDEAERLHRRALELRRQALGPEAPEVAASHNNLGALYWSQDRLDEAEPHFRAAAELLERSLGPDHPRVADAFGKLGILASSRGRFAEGEAFKVLVNLGLLYERAGRPEEAEPLHRRVLGVRERTLGGNHPATARARANLAIALRDLGRTGEARTELERALADQRAALPPTHQDVVRTEEALAALGGPAPE